MQKERISLSIKDTLPGPWSDIEEKVAKGSVLDGRVKRLFHLAHLWKFSQVWKVLVHISQIAHKHIIRHMRC